jgi:hypothetical protein
VHRSMGVAADESERQDHDEAAGEQRSHKRRGLRVVLDYLRGVPRLRHSTDHGQRLGGTCRVVAQVENGRRAAFGRSSAPFAARFRAVGRL